MGDFPARFMIGTGFVAHPAGTDPFGRPAVDDPGEQRR